jgi:hypothetical protein
MARDSQLVQEDMSDDVQFHTVGYHPPIIPTARSTGADLTPHTSNNQLQHSTAQYHHFSNQHYFFRVHSDHNFLLLNCPIGLLSRYLIDSHAGIMRSITVADLPCEVVASILKNLDNARFILPCILVCRKFYLSYQQYPSIKRDVVANHISESLLPYAVAVRVASHLPKPLSAASIDGVLDNIYGPHAQLNTRSALNRMTFDDLRHIIRMHDIIHELVMEFASSAWSILSPDDINLSSSEYFRFYRAFYRFELLCSLFSTQAPKFSDLENSKAKAQFLSKHPPWENEQIGCVHDFLERKMSKGQ